VRTIVAARDAIGKPIVSYIEYTAHSAAYFLVAGVSNAGIYCLPEASVGSIGIVGRLTDNSKANDLHGYKVRLVREPPGKAAEDPDDPVPDIALARVTEHIATLASRFYTVVANARNISPQALRDLNGGYFSGEKALDLGLVDGIETFSDAVSRAFGTRTGLSNSTYAMIGEGAQMEDANTLVHRGLQFKTMQSVTQPTGIVAGVQPLSPTTLNAVLPQPPQAPGVLQHAPIVAPVNVKMESPPAGDPPADSKGSGNTGADLAAALTELAGAATAAADALVSGNIDAALPATSTVMAAMDRCRGIAQALFGGAFGSQQSEQAPAAVPVSMAQMYSIVSDIQKTVAQQQAVSKAQQEIIERTRLLSGKRIPKDKAAAINTMPIENLRIAVTMLDDASVVHPAAGLFPHIPQPGNPVTPSGLTPEQAADCARLNGNPQAYQRLIAGLQIT
ncbi:MAG: S49 family peptidase, partial [Polyangiaceae bacterium]|nr:S49 family peptidase [Polyangiaceae bacterium]